MPVNQHCVTSKLVEKLSAMLAIGDQVQLARGSSGQTRDLKKHQLTALIGHQVDVLPSQISDPFCELLPHGVEETASLWISDISTVTV